MVSSPLPNLFPVHNKLFCLGTNIPISAIMHKSTQHEFYCIGFRFGILKETSGTKGKQLVLLNGSGATKSAEE